jgi:acyl carrier protein
VLHAASDIPQTLAGVRSLLAPGGLLVLIEVTEYLDWFDVSTALLEGWDRQGDDLRPEHPMLPAASWETAARAAGFAEFLAFPAAGSPAEVMAQHVLVAQAPLGSVGPACDVTVHGATRADGAGTDSSRAGHDAPAADFAALLAAAAEHEREDRLVDYVRRHIAALLRLDSPDRIDRRGRLMELGLDSLMAVELRSRLGRGLALAEPLPATLIFDYPTVESITALLQRLLQPATPAEATAAVPLPSPYQPVPAEDLDALTDEEVEARLVARLESIEGRTP